MAYLYMFLNPRKPWLVLREPVILSYTVSCSVIMSVATAGVVAGGGGRCELGDPASKLLSRLLTMCSSAPAKHSLFSTFVVWLN